MFELKNDEGFFQKSIANHLSEVHSKFAIFLFFYLSVKQFDLVELITDELSKKSYNRNLYLISSCSWENLGAMMTQTLLPIQMIVGYCDYIRPPGVRLFRANDDRQRPQ